MTIAELKFWIQAGGWRNIVVYSADDVSAQGRVYDALQNGGHARCPQYLNVTPWADLILIVNSPSLDMNHEREFGQLRGLREYQAVACVSVSP